MTTIVKSVVQQSHILTGVCVVGECEHSTLDMERSGTDEHIRVVVGVDFGTTFSGFAFAHVGDPNYIVTQEKWPTGKIQYKTNTILHYDRQCDKVVAWGCGAVLHQKRKRARTDIKVAELFKLYLTDAPEKPRLPDGLDFRKAIRDYLKEMNEVIRKTLNAIWDLLVYPQNVRFVFTVPAEYGEQEKGIMRRLIHKAGFLDGMHSHNLEFTTEPEAAAICCLKRRDQYDLKVGDSFLVVDCGGGTCDLTVRKLLKNDKISEITQRAGAVCGGSLIDLQFVRFLDKQLGGNVMEKIISESYPDYQHLIDDWCRYIKHGFNGNREGFETYQLEIDKTCPPVMQHVCNSKRAELAENDWLIDIDYDSIRAMFDPVVNQITELIARQLDNAKERNEDIAIMFLVGGFSESKYLQETVKSAFLKRVPRIVNPMNPATAILQGAVQYGLRLETINSRVLKWTYGIETHRMWKKGDPLKRRTANNKMKYFQILAEKGTEVGVDEQFSLLRYPLYAEQTKIEFPIYITQEDNPLFTDEPGMKRLGVVSAELPNKKLKKERPVTFSLVFGAMEFRAVVENKLTDDRPHIAKFELDL